MKRRADIDAGRMEVDRGERPRGCPARLPAPWHGWPSCRALGSRGGATDHFPKRDRLTASPLSSAPATPGPCFFTGSRRHHEADGHGSRGAPQRTRAVSFSSSRWYGPCRARLFFRMSRSSRNVRTSRRRRPSSSRSSVVRPSGAGRRPVGLPHPVANGVGRGLELPRQLLGRPPSPHQLDQSAPKLS